MSQQVDVASPNQSPGFTGHSSVSQSVSQPVGVWAALCSCALLHSLSRRQRRGGRREEGWGSGQAPSPVPRTTNGSGAARTERTSYLSTRPTSVRAGDFPPSSVREARVLIKGCGRWIGPFLTLFSNTARKQFLSASNSTGETLEWESNKICVWLLYLHLAPSF